MSQKEVKRAQVLDMLKEGEISRQEAAQRMGVSARQARRLAKHYLAAGLSGSASKKRGRASSRRLDETIRATAIELIGAHCRDFGPALANEKLAELRGIRLSVESVRRLMMRAGYWKPKRGGAVRARPVRERRARFGEMTQIDGGPRGWFEGRGERCTLLVFIDDATGELAQPRFMPAETAPGYVGGLHDHILAHGVPAALYSDKHSIFRINAKEADPGAGTRFSRAARELGIECVRARSPRAKGRAERANHNQRLGWRCLPA